MGSELMSFYRRRKLCSTLEEAESDFSRLPFIDLSKIVSRIRSIETTCPFIPAGHLHDLIDVLSECRILAHQPRKRVPFLQLNRLGSRLDDIETKLGVASPPEEEEDSGNWRSTSGRGTIQPTSPNVPDPSRIIGFESQEKEIEGLLLPNNSAVVRSIHEEGEEAAKGITAIGIVGRCGCGKTALARKVFDCARVKKEFSPTIWVDLSGMLFDNNPRKKLLKYILAELGDNVSESEYPEHRVFELLEKLQCKLMGKRYLIVLDDAWRMDEFFAGMGCSVRLNGESFASGLPRGSEGAVVVTGRGEEAIGRMVGDEYVIRPPQLGEEICWGIFCEAVRQEGKNIDVLDHLDNMKADVIRSCDGLPLAAVTLAKIIPDLL